MSVTPLAVAEVTQRGRRKPTSLTLDLAGVRAAIAELQRAERVLLAAQAAADAPGDAYARAEHDASPEDLDDGSGAPGERDASRGSEHDASELATRYASTEDIQPAAPEAAAAERPADGPLTDGPSRAPDGQDAPGPAARGAAGLSRGDGGRIRKAEVSDVTGGREVLIWGDPRIDEVLAAGGTLVRTFDVLIAGGVAREWTAPRSHPELFLVPAGHPGADGMRAPRRADPAPAGRSCVGTHRHGSAAGALPPAGEGSREAVSSAR
jgi:hypothetical protein